jgi:tyrosyl-tRNA synthetase
MTARPDNALDAARARGLIKDITDPDGLAAAMRAPVSAYAGFDPTAGSLHVGHLVPVMLLRLLARHGHAPIALVGGVTARIGDPSGRRSSRPLQDDATVADNADRLRRQLSRLLGPEVPVLDNTDWLGEATLADFLRAVAVHVPVSRLLAMESVRSRLDAGGGLSALELFYPLLQAADFLTLHRTHGCRLQIGGSDQWGNILAGADLIRRCTGAGAFGLTQPLALTAAGTKMGKTAGGAVWLDPELTDDHSFFQFWRSCADADVGTFLRLFTELPLAEIDALTATGGAALNPAKARLADAVTRLVRGPAAADRARRSAGALFGDAGDPASTSGPTDPMAALPEHPLDPGRLASGVPLPELLQETGLAGSRSAARRLLQQGGVRLDGVQLTDPARALGPADLMAGQARLSAGRRRHLLLRVAGTA